MVVVRCSHLGAAYCYKLTWTVTLTHSNPMFVAIYMIMLYNFGNWMFRPDDVSQMSATMCLVVLPTRRH
jgi:hypothetical protein